MDGSRAAWVACALVAFTIVVYAPTLRVPFIGDDYRFLEQTRNAPFVSLWSLRNTDFGWYRPWSREFHFWTLQHLFGPHETGFRVASLAIWLAALGVYFALLRRIAGDRIASLAVLGVASLSLWGAPLTWIAGVQDLWMLLFTLLALLFVSRHQPALSWLACAGALFSKETAAVLPLLVFAYARWIERGTWLSALRRAAPFALITIGFVLIHPVLVHRLTHPAEYVVPNDLPQPPLTLVGDALLSLVNADRVMLPIDPGALRALPAAIGTLLLAAAAFMVLRGAPASTKDDAMARTRRELAGFGVTWCIVGWLPLFSRSIGWHAYYGGLGVLGAWAALSCLLAARPAWAVALIATLGLLRGHAEAARSWDWGSQWYQTRAGNMLRVIHDQVLQLHPTLPRHTRLYFGGIPNNIGLIAGSSTAARVWYDDPTLQAGYYSYYRARLAAEDPGLDLFFHFDSTSGIREVSVDGADVADPRMPAADWEADHASLAVTLLGNGDLPRAARLFEAIARLPNRPDALMFAAVAWQAHGDSAAAEQDFSRAQARTGLEPGEIRQWAARLRATMPKHTPTVP